MSEPITADADLTGREYAEAPVIELRAAGLSVQRLWGHLTADGILAHVEPFRLALGHIHDALGLIDATLATVGRERAARFAAMEKETKEGVS